MTDNTGDGQIAPLANIGLIEQAIFALKDRGASDPGLFVVSGPSGYGKSVAAAWAKARHQAYYLQLDDFVSKKVLLESLCLVMGLGTPEGKPPKGTVAALAAMVARQLHSAQRPLIIDEFDFAIEKSLVMAVFSLYEMSRASIILIGEEAMPGRLEKWDKFSGRVLDTLYAEAVGIKDARILARTKNANFPVADDLLEHLVGIVGGSVRLLSNNLRLIYQTGASEGWDGCDLARWGNRPLQHAGVKRRGK